MSKPMHVRTHAHTGTHARTHTHVQYMCMHFTFTLFSLPRVCRTLRLISSFSGQKVQKVLVFLLVHSQYQSMCVFVCVTQPGAHKKPRDTLRVVVLLTPKNATGYNFLLQL